MALVTGKPVFLEDVLQGDYLVVKLLHSPHANAMIEEIRREAALKVPGIEAIYTLGGCAAEAVYPGRPDLPGAQPL